MNTELSHQAILQLLYEVWALRDVTFQSWMGVTFAAILAIYFSSVHITKFLRFLIVFLYIFSAIMFLAGWITLGNHAMYYFDMLEAGKLSRPPVVFAWVAPLQLSLMFLGSIATAFFLCVFKRE